MAAFNGSKYIENIARRILIDSIQGDATNNRQARGTAIEDSVRGELRKLLPAGVRIGTGFVIDTFGGTSQQQDIVIYESLCPCFPLSSNTEVKCFPVEGVIAVGEVKTSLDKTKLKEAFENIYSVKSLRRRTLISQDIQQLPPAAPYRHYQESLSFTPDEEEGYSQNSRDIDQVFGFVLALRFRTSGQELLTHASEYSQSIPPHSAPNLVASLESGFIAALKGKTLVDSAMEADGLFYCDESLSGFSQLIVWLRRYCLEGRTVPAENYSLYFTDQDPIRKGFRRAGYAKTRWLGSTTG
ncbi:DUF6602 domain-containing protein [Aquibium sp. ELW1220]|uniref:DUF6602 domain-containing protein n=1 Tax=Aquibium sp. ELW1220 TaxID=2976766 RepID=UPI0025B17B95|nr:DUF6602 domain-containing protein [Aquibium sp. ELW1220]MDN2583219.1 hypothetical protein [Aquibium sp. ELW1220]